MFLQIWRFITLLLAALGLTMGAAHLLELPQKIGYSPELYAAVNTTLYRYFGLAGGILTVAAILAAGVLVFLSRRHPSFGLALAGTLCLAFSFLLWLALVSPVNTEVAHALQSAPETVPGVWMRLRDRWEYGHVAAFSAWLVGFSLLLLALLREIPVELPDPSAATEPGREAEPIRPLGGRPQAAA